MKKTINILLAFICLFALASCSMFQKGDPATKKDLLDFLKDKDLYKVTETEYDYDVAEGVYEYEFTYKGYEKNKEQDESLSRKINVKGRVCLDIQKDTSNFEYYLKGKGTEVRKVPTTSGQVSNKETYKEEMHMTITSDHTRLYYIDQEVKSKSTYGSSKTERKIKTSHNEGVLNSFVPNFEDILEDLISDGVYGFINDKKCTIISSDASEKTTVEMWFDGDDITKVKLTRETHEYKEVAVLKFKDVDSIGKPKDASDYEDIDKTK